MMVLYSRSMPASVWREVLRDIDSPCFRAQIAGELDEHSPNDDLSIRFDHCLEGNSAPAPDGVADADAAFMRDERSFAVTQFGKPAPDGVTVRREDLRALVDYCDGKVEPMDDQIDVLAALDRLSDALGDG